MIRKYKWTLLAGSFVTVLPILAGLLLWNRLPEQIPIHWGVNGEPDGWSSKTFGVLALPGILLAIHWLGFLFMCLDPKNQGQSKKMLTLGLWICPGLSVLLGCLTLGTGLGWEPDVSQLITLFMGVLFMLIGNYMPKCTRNYTIGIKIPWTLDSEENWNATHRFAGRVWLAGGLLLIPFAFLKAAVPAMLGILLVITLAPIVYSWRFHRKENS